MESSEFSSLVTLIMVSEKDGGNSELVIGSNWQSECNASAYL